MDQITAVVETIHYADQRVHTTRYLSECGCEWVVDMWGNVRRVKICPRDTGDIRWENQLGSPTSSARVSDSSRRSSLSRSSIDMRPVDGNP